MGSISQVLRVSKTWRILCRAWQVFFGLPKTILFNVHYFGAWPVLCGLPKTILFNVHYFGLRRSLGFPVVLSHKVKLLRLRGSVTIAQHAPIGGISIGFGHVGIFDKAKSRTIWENDGRVTFAGRACIGHGSRISVGGHGDLYFGDKFEVSAESAIRCGKHITFGNGCLISWDVLIMDQDFHTILNSDRVPINPDADINIGERVWIGCRNTILKGTVIGSDSVIAAGSLIAGEFLTPNQIIGGNPAHVLKSGISWY
jgi:acetyltransferase-like isoleucine patch superfamily enzyme